MKVPNLGKRLQPGDTFRTTTKQMTKLKGRIHSPEFEVLKKADQRFFTKGKRRYWCEVLCMVEMRTGFNAHPLGRHPVEYQEIFTAPRWWMFTYLVRVLEN